jgi:hypothetical protein
MRPVVARLAAVSPSLARIEGVNRKVQGIKSPKTMRKAVPPRQLLSHFVVVIGQGEDFEGVRCQVDQEQVSKEIDIC